MNRLLTGLTGASGLLSIQVLQNIDPGQLNEIVKLLGSLVISVVTLIGLLKKRPEK